MILPINNTVDWELTSQKKQAKTNKDNIQKNSKIVDHNIKSDIKSQSIIMLLSNMRYHMKGIVR